MGRLRLLERFCGWLFKYWSLQHQSLLFQFQQSIAAKGLDTHIVLRWPQKLYTRSPKWCIVLCSVLKLFVFSFFLSLSVSCYWLFNRKQRQQSLGTWWKTTTWVFTQLSTNVATLNFISSSQKRHQFASYLVGLLQYSLLTKNKYQFKPNLFIYLAQQHLHLTSHILVVQQIGASVFWTLSNPSGKKKINLTMERIEEEYWITIGFYPRKLL